MELNKLTIKDKKLLDKFLSLERHELSTYAFENIYIWKGLFDISWLIIEDSLCIFFKDKIGCFLYLAPLGEDKKQQVLKKTFAFMDKFNKNKDISRIENVEAGDLPFYENLGFVAKIKSYDYICASSDLAKLKGSKFKSKRASLNYFIKHNNLEYLPFSLRYRDNCFELYNRWREQRKAKTQDPIYKGMLDDSAICLKVLLDSYQDLNVVGRVVKINGEISAFTFSFKLNPETLCVLYEITDLSIKGLAQFIFRSFCNELKDYKYINIMDDSNLENLKKVKLSYQPVRLIPAYIVKRKDGPQPF